MAKRVLLFPLPYQGHINPMLELAAVLHSRGFSITIFHTTFNSIDSTKYPSYRFISVEVGELSSRFGSTVTDCVHRIICWNNSCEQLFHDCLTSVLSDKSEEPIACLIRDMHWYNLQYIADKLQVPALVLRTGNAASLNWFMTFPLLLEKGFIPVQESNLDMPVVELDPLRGRDLPGVDTCNQICDLYRNDFIAVRASSGVIVNTFDAIDSAEVQKFQNKIPIPVFSIGPLHKFTPLGRSSLLNEDRSCLDWMDTQAPGSVLYVSFMDTHNSWNSTLEAICEGVPMICRPQFADQMGNARYVTHVWKVGIRLEGGLERGKIEQAIKRLLRDNEGAEIRQRMKALKNEASCCIKSDGSSSINIHKLVNFISSF